MARALERFDGCDVDPAQLHVSEEEFTAARETVSSELLESHPRWHRPCAAVQRATRSPGGLELRKRAGAHGGREGHPHRQCRVVRPQRQGFVPVGPGAAGHSGGGGRRAATSPWSSLRSPARLGDVDPAVLVVAQELGIYEVFRANGPAGVAALAFGTETIPKVRKVVGPGARPWRALRSRSSATGR